MKKYLLVAAAMIASLFPVPAAHAAPAIDFLNPSDYSTTLLLSDKLDQDNTYHFVAWVQDPPAAPIVEFEIEQTGAPTTTVTAARVANTDTWEADISLDPFLDSQATVRAFLFDGQAQVAESGDQIVTIREQGPLPPAAETVEITHPDNGENLGFFTPSGGNPRTVIDGLASNDAAQVRAFYTLSDPGSDPEWVSCGSGAADATTAFVRARCTLADDTPAAQVTAVALVANQTPAPAPPQGPADQSGDAHRVFPVVSSPTSVQINPSATTADPDACQQFVATLLDQDNRPLAGANIDVHAVGPDDQLRFAVDGNDTDDFQAPDKNHVSTEPALDCSDDGAAGDNVRQGDHNVPGQDDTKHIESAADGTGTDGSFVFALHSEVVGGTHITAFGDADGDDQLDTSEASGGAQLGWGQPPPAPETNLSIDPNSADATIGQCERFEAVARRGGNPLGNSNIDVHIQGPDGTVQFCDPPDAGARRSPDAGGHIVDSHEDGTRHAEGETSSNGVFVFGVTSTTEGSTSISVWLDETDDDVPTGEPSANAQVSWSPPGERDISIEASKRRVERGRLVRLFGGIDGADTCADNQPVKIKAKRPGGRYKTIKSGSTNDRGNYSVKVLVRRTKIYRAIAPAGGVCNRAASGTVRVRAT